MSSVVKNTNVTFEVNKMYFSNDDILQTVYERWFSLNAISSHSMPLNVIWWKSQIRLCCLILCHAQIYKFYANIILRRSDSNINFPKDNQIMIKTIKWLYNNAKRTSSSSESGFFDSKRYFYSKQQRAMYEKLIDTLIWKIFTKLTFSSIMLIKITLKILRCSQRMIFKVCLTIFQHYAWKS